MRVMDENGLTIVAADPFYDVRDRTWHGEPPDRRGPNVPGCLHCGSEGTEIWFPRHVDSDGLFHYTVYHCRSCGRNYRVEEADRKN